MLNEAIVSSPSITSNAVFISNNLLALAHILKEVLSQKEKSLRTIVIIPSNPIKNFLTQALTDSSGAFFGVRFLTLAQAIEHFLKLSYSNTFTFPPFSNLSLHIESLLLNPTEKLLPLLSYLGNDRKKISSLSRELSHVFLHYGVYGSKALDVWEKTDGWQQTLWHEVLKTWDFPCEILKEKPAPKIPTNLILFNLPHIPSLYKNFIEGLSSHFQTSYFLRIPSNLPFDNNPLLDNFGSLIQSNYLWLSEKETYELFIPPIETSTLSIIQSDIFAAAPCRKVDPDSSLQVHEASSPLREIEILLENLKIVIKDGSLLPEDIIVLASDLDRYFPHIQFIFEQESCPLGYSISDLSSLPHNHFLKTVDLFFSLVESRFEKEAIIELLFSEPIAKRQNFGAVEFSLLHQIIEDMNIEWGFDQEMKQEILETEALSERGSWKFAFDQLLISLAFRGSIEISKFETLGNLLSFLVALFTDLRSLKKREETLSNWIVILDDLLRKYFLDDDELDFILKEIHSFGPLAKKIDSPFLFSSIHSLLIEILSKKSFERYYTKKPVIQFANLSEGSSLETKIIFILGLDEDSFPRKRVVRSLNQLKGDPGCDHLPENSEKDRFFFLESILSAKEKLIISYIGLSEKDGKPLAPSLCVSELLHNFTSSPIKKHPNIAFYPKPREKVSFAIISLPETPLTIDIRHLIELVKHPIRFYCNRVLGVYLDKATEKDSREFFLSYLDRAVATDPYQKQSNEELFEMWEKKNLLPTALFQESAKIELLSELKEVHLGLKNFSLSKHDFFSIHFDPSCKEPSFLDSNRYIHPAIHSTTTDGRPFTLIGKLPALSKEGIYIHKNYSISELWKHLPHLSILSTINSPVPATLLFGKDSTTKTSPFPLPSLIEYYLQASTSPSPLLPDQIDKLLKKKLFSPTSFFDDPYLTFLPPDLTKDWDHWLELLT